MLTIQGPPGRMCEGLSRRDFLRVGSIGSGWLTLPRLLRAAGSGDSGMTRTFGRAKQCLLVFLWGGPSQLDMWDLKPDAPQEVRGELSAIATNVPGIRISELLPLTARHADKYKIVRSVTHTDRIHSTGAYTMLTGVPDPGANVKDRLPTPEDHPHIGAIYSKWRNSGGPNSGSQLPPFVALPTTIALDNGDVIPGQTGGFLGRRHDPLVVNGDYYTAQYELPAVKLPRDVSHRRLQDRKLLLDRINRRFEAAELSGQLSELDMYSQQAFSLISAGKIASAFDLTHEPEAVRDRYGRHLFGQGCLMARRLLEARIPLVTVYWHDEGFVKNSPFYDSHRDIYKNLRTRLLPPTDRALASLFDELSERGLLDETLVIVMGEFGRTPKINERAGRDHWPWVQSILLAGAGISGGTVLGSSDKLAAYPASFPVAPADLTQTILHMLGVPADLELHHADGRPIAACDGIVRPELMA